MNYIADHFKMNFEPEADTASIVTAPFVRFTVLAPRIIRMEYSTANKFEDRASLAFWYRKQPVPAFKVVKGFNYVEIITEYLHLRYEFNEEGFTYDSLSINMLKQNRTWHYGEHSYGNLKGTARTLDAADGEIPLQDGLLSRDGWSILDDSSSVVFDENSWVTRRFSASEGELEESYKDLYFFGYGTEYKECISDFIKLSGKTPMLPRWALGNWWSRYWPYKQDELQQLMEDFQEKDIPLSVCIVDMDWHIVNNPYSSGWTGYTWNKELFPDPKGFIDWLHKNGLKTALNLHPADGIQPHEEQYPKMAEAMGIDPESGKPVDFDIRDPKFTKYYFEILHHPHEEQGVDFWWMDWQQGTKSKLKGLDPLPWLNHLHFYDLGRDGNKRGFVFSRYGGPGSHRYPIGFSGDTYVTWDSLKFQPYFTSTASNIAYGWWSHDIGGHMDGIEDPELYTRWVQYGVFSPILRLHSTNTLYNDRRPWSKGLDVLEASRAAMKLRNSLIPYLYSMMWRNHRDNIPPIVPMYYEYPDLEEAYRFPNQYYFGTELIAAPFVEPMDKDLNMSRQSVWLPEGNWFNFFTGEHFDGGKIFGVYGDLQDIPIFARAGAIIPMASAVSSKSTENPKDLDVYIFPGACGSFELYEDDGESRDYENGGYAITTLSTSWQENSMSFTILPTKGHLENIPKTRSFNLLFRGIRKDAEVKVIIDTKEINPAYHYDSSTETMLIDGIELNVQSRLQVYINFKNGSLMSRGDRRVDKLRKVLMNMRYSAFDKRWIDEMLIRDRQPLSVLSMTRHKLTASQMRAIIETLKGEELSTLL